MSTTNIYLLQLEIQNYCKNADFECRPSMWMSLTALAEVFSNIPRQHPHTCVWGEENDTLERFTAKYSSDLSSEGRDSTDWRTNNCVNVFSENSAADFIFFVCLFVFFLMRNWYLGNKIMEGDIFYAFWQETKCFFQVDPPYALRNVKVQLK